MPSTAEHGATDKTYRQDARQGSRQNSWPRFWLSIVRIFVIQVVLLIALSGAFVTYLNWSSAKSFAEFLSAGAMLAPSNPPLQSIKSVIPCDRGA